MKSRNINFNKSERFASSITKWACVIGLFLGYLIVILPWWLVLGFCFFSISLALIPRYPFAGVLIILAFIFEAFPGVLQPKLPIGGAELKPYDLIFIYLVLIVSFHALFNSISLRYKLGRLWWPIIYLLTCIGVSLVYVKFYLPNKMALADFRGLIYWLLIPLITLVVDSRSKFRIFLRAIIVISLIVSLYVISQSLLNIHIMSFRVEELDSANNKDITRSIAGGGTYIIIFSLYFLVNRLLEKRTSIFLTMPIVFMFLIALAVTYGRGVWLATGVGFIISAYLFRGMRGAVLVSMLGALFIIILYGSFSVVKPRIADAIYERASGFFTEVDHGDSLGWRKMENRLAITSIENNPFLGVGLGGEYKLTMSSRGSFLNETRYIHNGYLYYPLKMGLIAAFIPFALIYGFVRTYRESRTSPLIDDRALLAATGGAFCVPVITSFTQPEWANISGIAAFSVLISFVILYRMHGSFLDTQNDPK